MLAKHLFNLRISLAELRGQKPPIIVLGDPLPDPFPRILEMSPDEVENFQSLKLVVDVEQNRFFSRLFPRLPRQIARQEQNRVFQRSNSLLGLLSLRDVVLIASGLRLPERLPERGLG